MQIPSSQKLEFLSLWVPSCDSRSQDSKFKFCWGGARTWWASGPDRMPENVAIISNVEPEGVDCSSYYVKTRDLVPDRDDPVTTSLLSEVGSNEWTRSCNAMLAIRRTIRFQHLSFEEYAKEALELLLQEASSLRSVVSKSALLCVTDLLDTYDTHVLFTDDTLARSCFICLVEMNLTGKRFVAVEAKKALEAYSRCLPVHRSVGLSLALSSHRNANFRRVLLQNMCYICTIYTISQEVEVIYLTMNIFDTSDLFFKSSTIAKWIPVLQTMVSVFIHPIRISILTRVCPIGSW